MQTLFHYRVHFLRFVATGIPSGGGRLGRVGEIILLFLHFYRGKSYTRAGIFPTRARFYTQEHNTLALPLKGTDFLGISYLGVCGLNDRFSAPVRSPVDTRRTTQIINRST